MAHESLTGVLALCRASVKGRIILWEIIRQKLWLKRSKLDGPAYEYGAQIKMAAVNVRRKIISRRTV